MAPLILGERDLSPFIVMADAIACLDAAFRRRSAADVANVPRSRGRLADRVLNMMGAVDGSSGVYGTKCYLAGPDGVAFHVCLYDIATRRLLAVMDSSLMSQVRTGAASGVATASMANPDASVLGLIGTGRQAFSQVEAVLAVRPLREVRVFGRSPEPRRALADRIGRELGTTAVAAGSARDAVEGADVVCTITRASEPVLWAEWLSDGVHVNAAGANTADRRELDPAIIRRCAVPVTDDRQQARAEAAEFRDADAAGDWDWAVVADLADVVTGRVAPRRDPGDLTLFKSLGIAFEDVAYAVHLLKAGAAAGAWPDPWSEPRGGEVSGA